MSPQYLTKVAVLASVAFFAPLLGVVGMNWDRIQDYYHVDVREAEGYVLVFDCRRG